MKVPYIDTDLICERHAASQHICSYEVFVNRVINGLRLLNLIREEERNLNGPRLTLTEHDDMLVANEYKRRLLIQIFTDFRNKS